MCDLENEIKPDATFHRLTQTQITETERITLVEDRISSAMVHCPFFELFHSREIRKVSI